MTPAFAVERGGLLTTLQDLGRRGGRALGLPSCGALDSVSLRAANLLVGNAPGELALEVTLLGPALRALRDVVVAVVGAEAELRLDGRPVLPERPLTVRTGEQLNIGPLRGGARAYLAVRGGLQGWTVLGSASTDLRGGFGGLEGRALRRGDLLTCGPAAPARVPRVGLSPGWPPRPWGETVLRVLPGPEEGAEQLLSAAWTVTPASDRMGLRLSGPGLTPTRGDLPSEPVAPGVVQLPPAGQPIVLLADAGTHGGYLRPLVVLRADLPLLGQLRPGDRLRFERVNEAAAAQALIEQERRLRVLAAGVCDAYTRAAGPTGAP